MVGKRLSKGEGKDPHCHKDDNKKKYQRNRWGALKQNLSDVVLSEQRRTFREGKMVIVTEDGTQRSPTAEEKNLEGSPINTDRSVEESARQRPRISFTDSRFARAVSQRKTAAGGNSGAAALRQRQLKKMASTRNAAITRGNSAAVLNRGNSSLGVQRGNSFNGQRGRQQSAAVVKHLLNR